MSATNYPFPKCENGHDLTGEGAFIYDRGGNRRCRVCISDQRVKSKRKTYGAFDGGMPR